MLKHRIGLIGIALLCTALGSEALTLGRARGAVLIGRPLELSIPIHKDVTEDADALCFDAEVFHADSRQDASRVRVLVEGAAQSGDATVRILSSAIVDEPVVTVYLRTGCGQKTTRRYVLLADLASDLAAPKLPVITPTLSPSNVAAAPAGGAGAVESLPTTSAESVTRPARVRKAKSGSATKLAVVGEREKRPEPKADPVAAKSEKVLPKVKIERALGRARLKLDPLDFMSDRVANLDSFMNFDPSADALQTLQKVQTLEDSVKALMALNAKNETRLADMQARLLEAQGHRFPDAVLYALLALVLTCVAAIAWLWRRQRNDAEMNRDLWWQGSAHDHLPDQRDQWGSTPPAPTMVDNAPPVPVPPPPAQPEIDVDSWDIAPTASGVDVKHTEMRRTDFQDLDFPAPVRQRADFLVTLGRTDQAINALKAHLRDERHPEPDVFLDLLGLLHSSGMKAEFKPVSEEFQQRFTCQLPTFAAFRLEGRSLEQYPDLLSRIAVLWPAPKVLEVINAAIYKESRESVSAAFDLAAFRDLLLLQAIAQRVVEPASDKDRTAAAPPPGTPERRVSPSRVNNFEYSDREQATAPVPPEAHVPTVSPSVDLSLDEVWAPLTLDLDLSGDQLDELLDFEVPDSLDKGNDDPTKVR